MGINSTGSTSKYWLCPLYSFDLYHESIDLIGGIQIRPAPSELQKYLREHTYHLYGLWSDPSDVNWAAFLPYHTEVAKENPVDNIKSALEENHRANNLLFDLIISLKLCHQGQVVAGSLISASIQNSEWHIGGTTIWTPVSKRDFLSDELRYILHQKDVLQVNKIVDNLSKLRKVGKLDTIDIALTRFHSSYHGNIEDRIIDQMIAFESLYIGDSQELTYKLALRVAFLLGKQANQREVIFNDMKEAYKYRGRIVHGNTPVSREKLRRITSKTQDYLRQSIRSFISLLSKGYSLEYIRKHLLDENILKNGKLLALGE